MAIGRCFLWCRIPAILLSIVLRFTSHDGSPELLLLNTCLRFISYIFTIVFNQQPQPPLASMTDPLLPPSRPSLFQVHSPPLLATFSLCKPSTSPGTSSTVSQEAEITWGLPPPAPSIPPPLPLFLSGYVAHLRASRWVVLL